jgi:hypothetical protein
MRMNLVTVSIIEQDSRCVSGRRDASVLHQPRQVTHVMGWLARVVNRVRNVTIDIPRRVITSDDMLSTPSKPNI